MTLPRGLVFRHAVSRGRGRIVFISLLGLLATGFMLAQQPAPPAQPSKRSSAAARAWRAECAAAI